MRPPTVSFRSDSARWGRSTAGPGITWVTDLGADMPLPPQAIGRSARRTAATATVPSASNTSSTRAG